MTAAIAASPVLPQPLTSSGLLNLLIVEEDRTLREMSRAVATSLGYRAISAESTDQALRMLDGQDIDVVLLDCKLHGLTGVQALRQIKALRADLEVVVVTSSNSVEAAVEAMKAGAFDYLSKPFTLEELTVALEHAASHLHLKAENRLLREKLKSKQGFGNIIGRAPEMDKLYRIIAKAAHSMHPVLILGESGTGKEMVARAIHFSGPFRDKPFIPVDCGSLVPTLIESELFGHVKGAFTGAAQAKEGLLAIAEGGTVFLDEVGELPVDLQAKMLRALQEKEIRPVGSTRSVPINVRVLAATNRDLQQAVLEGAFRRDLYFRLNVLSVRIPPLRERRQDIPLLATFILERLSQENRCRYELSDDAMKGLLAYDWPGNVRELENCLQRCCALNSGRLIERLDLPTIITGAPEKLTSNLATEKRIVPLYELEKHAIENAIASLNGDKLMAAKLLGIGKTTLYRKLKEYGADL
jgi:DNA-binding NtrC family response regulator